ncbi:MAG: hydrogenase maturation protease [Ignavibacteriaceae bacterium]|nr:hydrogenase maturation protease [Ignavibacteriaceae bacterium]
MNFIQFTDKLSNYSKERIVFVGLGNELRGDDGVGIQFIAKLRLKKEFQNSHFIIAKKNPENYLQEILSFEPRVVVFIDAAKWNDNSGEIKFFAEEEMIHTEFSTHTFSIKIIKNFLLQHHQMDFIFLGIQPYSTGFGEGLSQPVKEQLKKFFS